VEHKPNCSRSSTTPLPEGSGAENRVHQIFADKNTNTECTLYRTRTGTSTLLGVAVNGLPGIETHVQKIIAEGISWIKANISQVLIEGFAFRRIFPLHFHINSVGYLVH
jgi:hypothetical protein